MLIPYQIYNFGDPTVVLGKYSSFISSLFTDSEEVINNLLSEEFFMKKGKSYELLEDIFNLLNILIEIEIKT